MDLRVWTLPISFKLESEKIPSLLFRFAVFEMLISCFSSLSLSARLLHVIGIRKLPPVSASPSRCCLHYPSPVTVSSIRLFRGFWISTEFFFGNPEIFDFSLSHWSSQLPLITGSLRFLQDLSETIAHFSPQGSHFILLLVYLLLKPRSALEPDPQPFTQSASPLSSTPFYKKRDIFPLPLF